MSASSSHPQSGDPIRTVWSTVRGARMHAVATGEGPPVVLVHGYGVSGTYMLPLARELASTCTVLVPDLPGQGKSDPLPALQSIADLGDVLDEWLRANAITRPCLVANSLGCQVVTDLAARYPASAGPLVLVGPMVDPERRAARHQIFAALRDSAREPLSLVAIAARDGATASTRMLLSTARVALADRIEDRLPLIEQPTVVVRGGRDGFVTARWAQRVAALLPNGRLVVVPGEAHAVQYTRPDLVAGIVGELLVEEREDDLGRLGGRFEHRDVAAG
jgi:pimeloyl-ACP methyl ester carboxylesterase